MCVFAPKMKNKLHSTKKYVQMTKRARIFLEKYFNFCKNRHHPNRIYVEQGGVLPRFKVFISSQDKNLFHVSSQWKHYAFRSPLTCSIENMVVVSVRQWSQKVSKSAKSLKSHQKIPQDRIKEIVPAFIVLIYGKTLGNNSREIRKKT